MKGSSAMYGSTLPQVDEENRPEAPLEGQPVAQPDRTSTGQSTEVVLKSESVPLSAAG